MEASGFFLICLTGMMVILLSYALDRLWAAAMPVRAVYLFIRFAGVVLHECAHIAGCLLTGARIRQVVLFSKTGGSVTYSRPLIPYIGDVVISTAPLFLLPLALSWIAWIFTTFLGCAIPDFPSAFESPRVMTDLAYAVSNTLVDNLLIRFNGWFLVYLYLTISIVLSVAPSPQDMKIAAAGIVLMAAAGFLVIWSGLPVAVSVLTEIVLLLGYGLTLGLVYGLVALAVSLPLLILFMCTRHG